MCQFDTYCYWRSAIYSKMTGNHIYLQIQLRARRMSSQLCVLFVATPALSSQGWLVLLAQPCVVNLLGGTVGTISAGSYNF